MKTTLCFAALVLFGAQAVSIAQADAADKAEAVGAAVAEEEQDDDLMLTTYIGFEFEGPELAEKFTALTSEQQNEVRLLVEDLIIDFWTDAGEPVLEDDEMVGEADDERMEGEGMQMAQVEGECEAESHCGGYGGYGAYGGYGGYGGYGHCGYGGYGGCGYGGCGCACTTYYRRCIPGCRRVLQTNVIHEDVHEINHVHNKIERHNVHIRKFKLPGYKTCQQYCGGCH